MTASTITTTNINNTLFRGSDLTVSTLLTSSIINTSTLVASDVVNTQQSIFSSLTMIPAVFSTLSASVFASSIAINMNGVWWKIPVALI